MSTQDPASRPHPATTAREWDERYSGDPVWSGNPNQALLDEVSGLQARRALDVGCGEGADSVWLAQRGWHVTSLDISPKAIQHTLAAADRAGVTVTGVASAFLDATLMPAGFELVSAMYPVLLKTPDRAAENRLLNLVVPGGHLLFVHHVFDADHGHGHGHGHEHHASDSNGSQPAAGPDHERIVLPQEMAALVRAREDWEILVDEQRERHVATGGGAHHRADHVLHARRLAV
ncbi:class I SAM-dependent methyltransferase [Luteococcus sp. Sow4_B9]|uniref:class I SAM-dependent methyltransferase n=1 Tax=Luteococcus sp. Sow4_B9 TaxID=3438792 RepID=UPI003F9D924E